MIVRFNLKRKKFELLMLCKITVELLQLKKAFDNTAALIIKTAFHKECFAITQS